MALSLKGLALARHGSDAVTLTQDLGELIRVLEKNPDIKNILSALCKQRDMLEAEVSRLGCKVHMLKTALSGAQGLNARHEIRIGELLELLDNR